MASAQNYALDASLLSFEQSCQPLLGELVDEPRLLLVFKAEIAVLFARFLRHELPVTHQNQHTWVRVKYLVEGDVVQNLLMDD